MHHSDGSGTRGLPPRLVASRHEAAVASRAVLPFLPLVERASSSSSAPTLSGWQKGNPKHPPRRAQLAFILGSPARASGEAAHHAPADRQADEHLQTSKRSVSERQLRKAVRASRRSAPAPAAAHEASEHSVRHDDRYGCPGQTEPRPSFEVVRSLVCSWARPWPRSSPRHAIMTMSSSCAAALGSAWGASAWELHSPSGEPSSPGTPQVGSGVPRGEHGSPRRGVALPAPGERLGSQLPGELHSPWAPLLLPPATPPSSPGACP